MRDSGNLADQWIYAACRTGQTGRSGQQTYTRSEGVDEQEEVELARLSTFTGRNSNRPSEISFGFSRLSTGRFAIWQSSQEGFDGAGNLIPCRDDLGRDSYFVHAFLFDALTSLPHPPHYYFRSASFRHPLVESEVMRNDRPPLLEPRPIQDLQVDQQVRDLLRQPIPLKKLSCVLAEKAFGASEARSILMFGSEEEVIEAFDLLWQVAASGAGNREDLSLNTYLTQSNNSVFTLAGRPRDLEAPSRQVLARFHDWYSPVMEEPGTPVAVTPPLRLALAKVFAQSGDAGELGRMLTERGKSLKDFERLLDPRLKNSEVVKGWKELIDCGLLSDVLNTPKWRQALCNGLSQKGTEGPVADYLIEKGLEWGVLNAIGLRHERLVDLAKKAWLKCLKAPYFWVPESVKSWDQWMDQPTLEEIEKRLKYFVRDLRPDSVGWLYLLRSGAAWERKPASLPGIAQEVASRKHLAEAVAKEMIQFLREGNSQALNRLTNAFPRSSMSNQLITEPVLAWLINKSDGSELSETACVSLVLDLCDVNQREDFFRKITDSRREVIGSWLWSSKFPPTIRDELAQQLLDNPELNFGSAFLSAFPHLLGETAAHRGDSGSETLRSIFEKLNVAHDSTEAHEATEGFLRKRDYYLTRKDQVILYDWSGVNSIARGIDLLPWVDLRALPLVKISTHLPSRVKLARSLNALEDDSLPTGVSELDEFISVLRDNNLNELGVWRDCLESFKSFPDFGLALVQRLKNKDIRDEWISEVIDSITKVLPIPSEPLPPDLEQPQSAVSSADDGGLQSGHNEENRIQPELPFAEENGTEKDIAAQDEDNSDAENFDRESVAAEPTHDSVLPDQSESEKSDEAAEIEGKVGPSSLPNDDSESRCISKGEGNSDQPVLFEEAPPEGRAADDTPQREVTSHCGDAREAVGAQDAAPTKLNGPSADGRLHQAQNESAIETGKVKANLRQRAVASAKGFRWKWPTWEKLWPFRGSRSTASSDGNGENAARTPATKSSKETEKTQKGRRRPKKRSFGRPRHRSGCGILFRNFLLVLPIIVGLLLFAVLSLDLPRRERQNLNEVFGGLREAFSHQARAEREWREAVDNAEVEVRGLNEARLDVYVKALNRVLDDLSSEYEDFARDRKGLDPSLESIQKALAENRREVVWGSWQSFVTQSRTLIDTNFEKAFKELNGNDKGLKATFDEHVKYLEGFEKEMSQVQSEYNELVSQLEKNADALRLFSEEIDRFVAAQRCPPSAERLKDLRVSAPVYKGSIEVRTKEVEGFRDELIKIWSGEYDEGAIKEVRERLSKARNNSNSGSWGRIYEVFDAALEVFERISNPGKDSSASWLPEYYRQFSGFEESWSKGEWWKDLRLGIEKPIEDNFQNVRVHEWIAEDLRNGESEDAEEKWNNLIWQVLDSLKQHEDKNLSKHTAIENLPVGENPTGFRFGLASLRAILEAQRIMELEADGQISLEFLRRLDIDLKPQPQPQPQPPSGPVQ